MIEPKRIILSACFILLAAISPALHASSAILTSDSHHVFFIQIDAAEQNQYRVFSASALDQPFIARGVYAGTPRAAFVENRELYLIMNTNRQISFAHDSQRYTHRSLPDHVTFIETVLLGSRRLFLCRADAAGAMPLSLLNTESSGGASEAPVMASFNSGDWLILELARGSEWHLFASPVPSQSSVASTHILARESKVYLFLHTHAAGTSQCFELLPNGQQIPIALPALAPSIAKIQTLDNHDHSVWLAALSEQQEASSSTPSGTITYALLFPDEHNRFQSLPLMASENRPFIAKAQDMAAFISDRLTLGRPEDDQAFSFYSFDAQGILVPDGPQRMALPQNARHEWVLYLFSVQAALGVVIALSLIVYACREEAFKPPLSPPSKNLIQIASLPRRGLAFLLDTIPAGFVFMSVFRYLVMRADLLAILPVSPRAALDPQRYQELLEQYPQLAVISILAFLTFIAMLTLYMGLFELRFSRTPGKMIMGITVTDLLGRPISPKNAMIRNVLRAVELYPRAQLLPLLVMILGFKRQRIGDLAAGTIVILAKSQPSPDAIIQIEPLPDENNSNTPEG